ncbi:YncE family protein, partial [Nitrosotalea sinensis]|uniref:YncE family protein n=1 Tax=Nitrosotalea sinensis TaxID=1499975 RepID=UPI0013FDE6BD
MKSVLAFVLIFSVVVMSTGTIPGLSYTQNAFASSPPSASVTSPANGATLASSTVTITGTASSSSNTVTSVQVSIDGAPYVTATGTTIWSYTANGLANGVHSITAKAIDNQGLIGYSTNVLTGATIPTGNGQELVFDPANGNIYVANIAQGTISVISSTTNHVISTISGIPGPTGIAYDSVNGYLYTANYNFNNISVVDTATNHVVTTISAGGVQPFGVAYVPNGKIYVANTGSNTVSVIDPSTNTIVGTIPAGAHPQDFAYDSTSHLLYMTNQGSNNVSVIDPSTNTVVATISVGISPRGISYDPANGDMYVANFNSNTVSIIDTSTNTVSSISTGSSGGPNGVAFDPANGFVYVPDFAGTRLNVIDSATNAFINPVILPSAPYYYYAIFDPVNSDIYITSGTNVAIIQTQTQFTVTVQDTTAPVVTVPAPITTSATGPSGAVVTFTTSATDPDDTAGPVQCNTASGSTFPIGTTTVTCTSTDTNSNTGTASFTVTVQDTTAPVVTVPAPITTSATGPSGAVVTFTTSATDPDDTAGPVQCNTASVHT